MAVAVHHCPVERGSRKTTNSCESVQLTSGNTLYCFCFSVVLQHAMKSSLSITRVSVGVIFYVSYAVCASIIRVDLNVMAVLVFLYGYETLVENPTKQINYVQR
jgi:hypothetical protein